MNLEELATRITRLEDIEAIKQLKATYCDICDDDHNPDRIVSIFTADGRWEGNGIADAKGHAEIRALFENFQASISFSQHMVMNPVITIDGDRASATWYFFGPFSFKNSNSNAPDKARWQSARYAEEYVRDSGVWKIAHLKIRAPTMSAPYADGWVGRTQR